MDDVPMGPNREEILNALDEIVNDYEPVNRAVGKRSSILKQSKSNEDACSTEDLNKRKSVNLKRVSFADKFQVMELVTGNIYDVSGKNESELSFVLKGDSETKPKETVAEKILDKSMIGEDSLPEKEDIFLLRKKHKLIPDHDSEPEKKKHNCFHLQSYDSRNILPADYEISQHNSTQKMFYECQKIEQEKKKNNHLMGFLNANVQNKKVFNNFQNENASENKSSLDFNDTEVVQDILNCKNILQGYENSYFSSSSKYLSRSSDEYGFDIIKEQAATSLCSATIADLPPLEDKENIYIDFENRNILVANSRHKFRDQPLLRNMTKHVELGEPKLKESVCLLPKENKLLATEKICTTETTVCDKKQVPIFEKTILLNQAMDLTCIVTEPDTLHENNSSILRETSEIISHADSVGNGKGATYFETDYPHLQNLKKGFNLNRTKVCVEDMEITCIGGNISLDSSLGNNSVMNYDTSNKIVLASPRESINYIEEGTNSKNVNASELAQNILLESNEIHKSAINKTNLLNQIMDFTCIVPESEAHIEHCSNFVSNLNKHNELNRTKLDVEEMEMTCNSSNESKENLVAYDVADIKQSFMPKEHIGAQKSFAHVNDLSESICNDDFRFPSRKKSQIDSNALNNISELDVEKMFIFDENSHLQRERNPSKDKSENMENLSPSRSVGRTQHFLSDMMELTCKTSSDLPSSVSMAILEDGSSLKPISKNENMENLSPSKSVERTQHFSSDMMELTCKTSSVLPSTESMAILRDGSSIKTISKNENTENLSPSRRIVGRTQHFLSDMMELTCKTSSDLPSNVSMAILGDGSSLKTISKNENMENLSPSRRSVGRTQHFSSDMMELTCKTSSGLPSSENMTMVRDESSSFQLLPFDIEQKYKGSVENSISLSKSIGRFLDVNCELDRESESIFPVADLSILKSVESDKEVADVSNNAGTAAIESIFAANFDSVTLYTHDTSLSPDKPTSSRVSSGSISKRQSLTNDGCETNISFSFKITSREFFGKPTHSEIENVPNLVKNTNPEIKKRTFDSGKSGIVYAIKKLKAINKLSMADAQNSIFPEIFSSSLRKQLKPLSFSCTKIKLSNEVQDAIRQSCSFNYGDKDLSLIAEIDVMHSPLTCNDHDSSCRKTKRSFNDSAFIFDSQDRPEQVLKNDTNTISKYLMVSESNSILNNVGCLDDTNVSRPNKCSQNIIDNRDASVESILRCSAEIISPPEFFKSKPVENVSEKILLDDVFKLSNPTSPVLMIDGPKKQNVPVEECAPVSKSGMISPTNKLAALQFNAEVLTSQNEVQNVRTEIPISTQTVSTEGFTSAFSDHSSHKETNKVLSTLTVPSKLQPKSQQQITNSAAPSGIQDQEQNLVPKKFIGVRNDELTPLSAVPSSNFSVLAPNTPFIIDETTNVNKTTENEVFVCKASQSSAVPAASECAGTLSSSDDEDEIGLCSEESSNIYKRLKQLRKKLMEICENDKKWYFVAMDDEKVEFEFMWESIFGCYKVTVPLHLYPDSPMKKIMFENLREKGGDLVEVDNLGLALMMCRLSNDLEIMPFCPEKLKEKMSLYHKVAWEAKLLMLDMWQTHAKQPVSYKTVSNISTIKVMNIFTPDSKPYSKFSLTFQLNLLTYPNEKMLPVKIEHEEYFVIDPQVMLDKLDTIEPGKYYLTRMVEASKVILC